MSDQVYTTGMGKQAIGVYLRVLRDKQRITQEEVATRLDVDVRQIRRWEKGSQDPAGSSLIQFLDYIHGQFEDVLQLAGNDVITEEVARAFALERYAEIQRLTPELTKRLAHVDQLVESFQTDLPRLDLWLGYGDRLCDERSGM